MALKKQISFKDALQLAVIRKTQKMLAPIEKKLRDRIGECFSDPKEGAYEKEVIDVDGIEVSRYFTGQNSPKLNQEKAMQLIEEKKLKSLAIKKIEVINPLGLKMALERKKITLEEYEALFETKVTMNIGVEDKRESAGKDDEEVLREAKQFIQTA